MDNDKPPVAPDYNFILNQQTTPLKPQRDRKVLVIFGGIGLLTITFVVLFMTSVFNKVATPTISEEANQASRQITQDYFSKLSQSNYNDAYTLLASNTQQLYDSTYFTNVVPSIFSYINTGDCQVRGQATAANGKYFLKYQCSTKNKQFTIVFNFTIVTQDQAYKIESYEMTAEERNATT